MRKQTDNSKTKRYALDKVSDVKKVEQGKAATKTTQGA